MLIRKPAADVLQAFVDPALTASSTRSPVTTTPRACATSAIPCVRSAIGTGASVAQEPKPGRRVRHKSRSRCETHVPNSHSSNIVTLVEVSGHYPKRFPLLSALLNEGAG